MKNSQKVEKLIQNNEFLRNYRRMWPYIKPFWFRALIAVTVSIPIGALDAVIALSLKPYMDNIGFSNNIKFSILVPVGIVVFTAVQGLLKYLSDYMNTWVGMKITIGVKKDLFEKLLSFETSFFDKQASGMIIQRFSNDVDSASNGLIQNIKGFVTRLFSSLSLIAVLIYNSWQLAIVAIVVLLCAFLPLNNAKKKLKGITQKGVIVSSDIFSIFNETTGGNKVISAYNLQNIQKKKFSEFLGKYFSYGIKMVQVAGWLQPVMHFVASFGVAIVIGYGSFLITSKQITTGSFVSFITALLMLYQPVKSMGNLFVQVQQSFLAIDRIFDLLGYEPKIKDKPDAVELNEIKNTISFENVWFEYIENTPVLKGISLDVKVGETVAFVGNSGGGKTTAVNMLPRFYDIKEGSIRIDGVDIRNFTLQSLRSKMAVVFQDNFLFTGTIKQNILLGKPDATDEEIHQALKMAFLDEFIASLENGLDTQIGERGVMLSGGQKQRVAIARAFVKNAPIVILDEATSALDNKSEAVVQKAIDNLMINRTVFVIAHRLSTVHNADKIAVINDGQIVELGRHEDLLNVENGAYKALYMAQFKKKEETVTDPVLI